MQATTVYIGRLPEPEPILPRMSDGVIVSGQCGMTQLIAIRVLHLDDNVIVRGDLSVRSPDTPNITLKNPNITPLRDTKGCNIGVSTNLLRCLNITPRSEPYWGGAILGGTASPPQIPRLHM